MQLYRPICGWVQRIHNIKLPCIRLTIFFGCTQLHFLQLSISLHILRIQPVPLQKNHWANLLDVSMIPELHLTFLKCQTTRLMSLRQRLFQHTDRVWQAAHCGSKCQFVGGVESRVHTVWVLSRFCCLSQISWEISAVSWSYDGF